MSTAFTKSEESSALVPDRELRDRALGQPELASSLLAHAEPSVLSRNRLLATEAMHLVMRLDRDLLEARAQWNQDWFRRLMRARPKAVARVLRRWGKINPPPGMALGRLRRRYHANLSKYLYEPRR
jgi:hypothetical protein